MTKQFYYKRNRIQQLKGFYYAIQAGTISGSAKRMRLSQSAVTLQIQSLERDLGVELFFRDAKKIKPTEAGKLLYSQAAHYIHGIDELFENFINFTTKKNSNILDIAGNHAVISYVLPKFLKIFKEKNPSVKFKIRNLSKTECIKRLLNDEIDLFIYPMNRGDVPQDLEFIPIVKYQPILLVRKDHILAKKKTITLEDVAKFELIRIDPHLITLPAFEEVIRAHGLKTNIEFEMSDWEILKKFVKADIGVAIISNIVLEGEENGDLVGRNLTNYFPEMTYGILLKKGKVPRGILRDFVTLLESNQKQSF
jgi:DNA-binding transcriptional LysR family regulator